MPGVRGVEAESTVKLSAFLGHDEADVIADLQENYGMSFDEATALVAKEYTRRRTLDEQDAIDAEHDID